MVARLLWGSDGSAACGGSSDLSEWPRSADEDAALSATKMPGTATGRALAIVFIYDNFKYNRMWLSLVERLLWELEHQFGSIASNVGYSPVTT